jgi:hypothetical protein
MSRKPMRATKSLNDLNRRFLCTIWQLNLVIVGVAVLLVKAFSR